MISEKSADVARRAKQLYEEKLRFMLENEQHGKYVAIEPESGDYFLGATYSEAVMTAREKHPDHISFVIRIGHDAAIHIGGMAS